MAYKDVVKALPWYVRLIGVLLGSGEARHERTTIRSKTDGQSRCTQA